MHISERGLKLIEEFEGFSAYPYDDGTGVMTIGFGTTAADVSPLPTHLTEQEAEDLLRRKLAEKYEPAINALGIPLNQNQFDALVSLAYNCGPGIVSPGYAIGRDLRVRDYTSAANDFLHYVYAGGRVLQGLVNRREAEKALFLTPVVEVAPDPYAIYATSHVPYGHGKTLCEVDIVRQYDALRRHPKLHAARLRQLERYLLYLAKLVAAAAIRDGRNWKAHNRGPRYQLLLRRARGEQVVK